MTWIDLFNAYKASTDIPQIDNYVVTINPVYREQNGKAIEVASDAHSLCIDLGGVYKDRYTAKVRVDNNDRVTATIDIDGVGDFSFPVTNNDEYFEKRVAITPWLSNYDKREELHRIYDWIFRVYNSIN